MSVRIHALTWSCLPLAWALGGALARAEPGVPMTAVWQEKHVNFQYAGRTARYSCVGLRDKVRALLLDLGARRDLKVAALHCDETQLGSGSASPSLAIVFSTPVLPDAAAKPLHDGDLAATQARFERFMITSDAFRNLGVADCELLAEFAHQLLPKFVTRELQHEIRCLPNQINGSRFWIRGEVLKSQVTAP